MSQRTDILCDRCNKVLVGETDQGAQPHWSVMFQADFRRSMRPGKKGRGWSYLDSASWDLCEDCAKIVAAVLVGPETGLHRQTADYMNEARKMLGLT